MGTPRISGSRVGWNRVPGEPVETPDRQDLEGPWTGGAPHLGGDPLVSDAFCEEPSENPDSHFG